MASNLFNKEHKAASDEYRKGYDRIQWKKSRPEKKEKEKDDRSSH